MKKQYAKPRFALHQVQNADIVTLFSVKEGLDGTGYGYSADGYGDIVNILEKK